MSVDEDTVKTGSPQASSTSALQLSECTGGYSNISVMVEGTAATPDFAAACPVSDTEASTKHTIVTEALSQSDDAGQGARRNENNINPRNSFHHSKQPQQTKLTKRRNTATSSFKHPTSGKRRRRANSESDSVLPTNFLLGGNIFDPLNLNSLLDEEVNRALNAETPKSSPLPAKSRDPVEILIPRDITDPLNLNSGLADSSFLVSPFRIGGRKRHRNRHHGGGGVGGVGAASGIATTQVNLPESGKSEVKTATSAPPPGMLATCSAPDVSKESNSFSSVPEDSHELSADISASSKEEMTSVSLEDCTSALSGAPNQHTSRRKRRRTSGKMEAPVTHSTPLGKSGSGDRSCGTGGREIPNPSTHQGVGQNQGQEVASTSSLTTRRRSNKRRSSSMGTTTSIMATATQAPAKTSGYGCFVQSGFEGKEVLDLGCNSGHLTLYIAKMLRPARILGVDIDNGLVHAARKNIRHYLSEMQTQEARHATQEKKSTKQQGEEWERESHRL
ncbi:hypothetical protein KUCAC02_003004 [Chaenocephalus aceratus]|uniref:Uncharacterized protein n=1 Tax=Chaenocephalus aceratus TaxID=36190 RepID=A0ACB9WL05_CHAAC|nr:hypothetical protein KUCAC02_003004 [Chaenocephalus aceratus]